ncbi:hypothetical protein [Microbacterium lacticum]|uniref:hypothetical protein n=1 Tax=Microbacterium lacticum TaxID=33885 RepID=UPI0011431259|nr:hypothetical protein [Microbacterium lacticum]GEB95603.1 hypothetical protein MLA01_18220 [Microbacterium lacticum]GGN14703.1 hypothetical protein GCM10009724_05300 [Microbacterium lacticum]
MQEVANALGVDRKALNHHVTDRESLLELLAIDAFRTRFAEADVDLGDTWQDACRTYAENMWQASWTPVSGSRTSASRPRATSRSRPPPR